ncbi:MAG: hypothetical protein P1U39_05160 [Legionellaceae bacterium]|nr:hypothetical protein [Legionellaceae bacterium]
MKKSAPKSASPRFFSAAESSEDFDQQCQLLAEAMTKKLTCRLENHEITQAMHDHAEAAIQYELEFLNATTLQQFELQATTAIDQAFHFSSSQASRC